MLFKDTGLLNKSFDEVKQHFEEIGLELPEDITIEFNNRLRTTLGVCIRKEGSYRIEIHNDLWQYPKVLLNTIAHELIHALPHCFNHGAVFKMMADKVKYSVNVTDINPAGNFKYKVFCPDCGFIAGYARMCNSITEIKYGLKICKKCGRSDLIVKKV